MVAAMVSSRVAGGFMGGIPDRHGAGNTRHAPEGASPASADDAFSALAGLFPAHTTNRAILPIPWRDPQGRGERPAVRQGPFDGQPGAAPGVTGTAWVPT